MLMVSVYCFSFLRGIDYMLEAKLSSGRALEAEQKVEGANLSVNSVCDCLGKNQL